MMIEYDVVRNTYLPAFIDEVNQKLKEGWELHGQMIIDNGFYQPIKRNVEETDK